MRVARSNTGPIQLCLVLMLATGMGRSVRAQQLFVGDPLEDYLRVLQVAGRATTPSSFTVRPLGLQAALASVGDTTSHPWRGQITSPAELRLGGARAGAFDPQLRLFENTGYPWGQNDGAVWQGRAVTLALDAGGFVRIGPLTIQVRPSLIWNQNQAFTLAPVNHQGRPIYGNPWHPDTVGGNISSIDLPQRFGPDAFWTLDPGQSSIRLEWRGAAAGFSTQNLWWGPGTRNSIMMSDNAAGFPHAFLATSHPVNVGIGTFEGQWIWGRLRQSQYFDSTVTLTRRFMTGAVATLSPGILPGLSLGVTRVFYESVPDTGLGIKEYFLIFEGIVKSSLATPSNPLGNDARDQLASVFARWVLPESGFEAYVEWARNDHSWNLRDFLLEPEHSQGYTLGFQKARLLSGGRWLRLNGEVTHLEKARTEILRAEPTYYAHHLVLQGYTQDGQVIGAGVGPGGDGQYLGADLFARWGRAGLFFQRTVNDNDAFYALAVPKQFNHAQRDVSLTAGATVLVFRGPVLWGASLAWTTELNRYFQLGNDVRNLNVQVWARWRLGQGSQPR